MVTYSPQNVGPTMTILVLFVSIVITGGIIFMQASEEVQTRLSLRLPRIIQQNGNSKNNSMKVTQQSFDSIEAKQSLKTIEE